MISQEGTERLRTELVRLRAYEGATANKMLQSSALMEALGTSNPAEALDRLRDEVEKLRPPQNMEALLAGLGLGDVDGVTREKRHKALSEAWEENEERPFKSTDSIERYDDKALEDLVLLLSARHESLADSEKRPLQLEGLTSTWPEWARPVYTDRARPISRSLLSGQDGSASVEHVDISYFFTGRSVAKATVRLVGLAGARTGVYFNSGRMEDSPPPATLLDGHAEEDEYGGLLLDPRWSSVVRIGIDHDTEHITRTVGIETALEVSGYIQISIHFDEVPINIAAHRGEPIDDDSGNKWHQVMYIYPEDDGSVELTTKPTLHPSIKWREGYLVHQDNYLPWIAWEWPG